MHKSIGSLYLEAPHLRNTKLSLKGITEYSQLRHGNGRVVEINSFSVLKQQGVETW